MGKRATICGDRYGFMKFGCLSVGGMLRTVRLRFGLRLEVCGTKVSIKGNCFGLHVKRIGIASLQSRVLPYTSHLAERPPKHEQRSGVTATNPRASGNTAHRAAPLKAEARSTRRGLRVGAVDSLEWGFVWGAQAMAGPSGAVCGCSNTSGEFNAIRS